MKDSFYTLPEDRLNSFLSAVIKHQHFLVAPVKTDLVRFQEIQKPHKIYLKENAYFPIKEYFFRKKETLFKYKNGKVVKTKHRDQKKVIFGLRRCDLNAIAHQDQVFLQGKWVDPYYQRQREKSLLIGYHCNTPPNKWCFCGSMDLIDFYDIMFFPRQKNFLVHIQTEAGKNFIKAYKTFFQTKDYQLTKKDTDIPKTDLLKKKDLAQYYDHPDWKKGAEQCLSCAACTNICPTCYCHEYHDEPSLIQIGEGRRLRDWSSCQLKSFTRVAGDHIFREDRLERFKHRIYHQLQYFRDQNGVNLCVGCGRCISGCPERIDFIKLINGMK